MKLREFFNQRLFTLEPRLKAKDIEKFFEADPKIANLIKEIPTQALVQILNIATGVEVELENVDLMNGDFSHYNSNTWTHVEDASLRNLGREFVTLRGKRMFSCISGLESLLRCKKINNWATSDRTSMHVHLNVNNLTFSQLKVLVYLYLLVERPLFSMVDPLRRHNIFCTPFLESPRLASLSIDEQDFEGLVLHAQKYCAFNLHSIRQHGTVEFRHMHVPKDLEEATTWLLLIGALKRAAAHMQPEEIEREIYDLKVSSNYDFFLNKIFFGLEKHLNWTGEDIDAAITDCKLLMVGEA